MKIRETPELPLYAPEDPYLRTLHVQFTKFWREVAQKVNSLAAGSYLAKENQSTAAPTTGTWVQGDFVWNSNPTELGGAGSKYVIQGWICTVGGTPGTWLQQRCLTGN